MEYALILQFLAVAIVLVTDVVNTALNRSERSFGFAAAR